MSKSVVIIDDSEFISDLLRDFFAQTLEFSVLGTGSNGMQAVTLYRQHRPDLLTMDLTMPVKDGRTALREILAEFPEARVLIISSQVGSPMLECMKIGAAGYVEKPLRLDDEEFVVDFKAAVDEALKRKPGGAAPRP